MKMLTMRFLFHRIGGHPVFAGLMILFALAMAPRARTEEPAVFAITNARIITVSGPPIEKGTVILRNGIIEAVGAAISIPGDARIVDATGMTVYPGLIDALSDIGLEAAAAQAAATTRAPGAPVPTPGSPPAAPSAQQPAQSPDERQGLTPYRQAADLINAMSRKIESARAAGITTALVAPRGGIFEGQSALVNLAGGDISRMVVETPVAFHISLTRSGGFGRGYPNSPMGIFAFVKQTLLDTQHYSAAWDIYKANPGAVRPEYNRALEALQPLFKQQAPVFITGDTPTEIQRLMGLADAYKFNFILAGGAEAGKIAPMLRDRKIPVILSVKYPERDRDGDPEAKEELNELRRRLEAPGTAAVLAKAGVTFAFQSGDTANPRDFIRNVGKAVEAGLEKETALRALTLVPAEILGVADRLGSIEKNKTANLILTDGDIFNSNTRIKFAFVDGRRYEITETDTPRAGETSGPTAESGGVAGNWTLNVNSPQGQVAVTLHLRQEGANVTGTVESPMGTAEITDGTVSGGRLTFRASAGGMVVTFSATVQGTGMTGTLNAGSTGTMDFTGSRQPRESSVLEEGSYDK